MKKKLVSIMILLFLITLFIYNIDNTDASTTTLAQTVINLSSGTTYTAGNGNGVYYTNSHEYRYVGGEVNNYVSFNNDLYRIIGVFDNNSTGVSGNLVKLIRARELMSVSWGVYNYASSAYTNYSNYKNNWDGLDSDGNTTNGTGVFASANVLLNHYYYNGSLTSSKYRECINWSYVDADYYTKSYNCSNVEAYGIHNDSLRSYIQAVTWYLYGYTGNSLSKQNWYNCERNNYSGCTSANSGSYSGTTIASIGLMYPSDYMYASGYVASSDTSTTGDGYSFIGLNWLYNGREWTIIPQADSDNYAFMAGVNGGIVNLPSDYAGGIRPTFYLKEDVYVTGGDGSFHNPYTIACDTCSS